MNDLITLIANTGLQFYTFETKIDPTDQKQHKFRFIEAYDSKRKEIWLDEVIALPNDKWAKKTQLEELGFLSKTGALSEKIEEGSLDLIADGDFFEVGNLNQTLKHFEKKWIPLPYFKKNNINNEHFGPTDWVRIYFERTSEDTLKIVLLVDTSTSKNPSDVISPFISENSNENIYSLSANDSNALAFVDSLFNCQWVEYYISKIFYKDPSQIEAPLLKHIGHYVFFTRVFRGIEKMPHIQLLSDKTGVIDVDLVVDVGNSNTCALLFENPTDKIFSFNTVKNLEIQDLDNPLKSYSESFSTRLVFKNATFGNENAELNQNSKFQWPSTIRIGFEAERIINDANVELKLSREVKTYNSSPKRYLWDTKPSIDEWEYHLDDINTPKKMVFKNGISQQLNSDGSLCLDNVFGTKSLYSRKSLMTFVYVELFSHALRQINSINFRSLHGHPTHKRKLKRIIISCPTAMIKQEQIALRECANEAMIILNRYNYYVNESETTNDIYENQVQVIPSVTDLKLDLHNLENRKDWIYDEATSAQLVMMYGMIKHKFGGNPDLFFNLYGKNRSGSSDPKEKKSIIVGSLDIGGGTSDLMICKYNYHYNEVTELTPEPLFWESFNLAGDDLLQNIIQQIIIEGLEGDENCTGVIENYARKKGIADVTKKLTGFFGKDSNNIGYRGKLMRVNFINQIGIPIAYRYMKHANTRDDIELSFDEILSSKLPNTELLKYFENHFGFKFEELKWKLSAKKTNEIIQAVFNKMIKQISNLMSMYSCDMVVLSGRPCSFDSLENLFLKYFPVSPNRLINLNKYWIGRWYPFADNNGFVKDPKTIVSVGSLISLMGGSLYKLDKFKINTTLLRSKLISTAEYIGPIENGIINEVIVSPELNENSITAHSLPYLIGFKNINSANYPARNIYSLEFDNDKILESITRNNRNLTSDVNDAIENFKHKLRMKLPFKISFSRDIEKDKEEMVIEEITDYEQNEISKSYFKLVVQTLPNKEGYWLDSGEFILNIRN